MIDGEGGRQGTERMTKRHRERERERENEGEGERETKRDREREGEIGERARETGYKESEPLTCAE